MLPEDEESAAAQSRAPPEGKRRMKTDPQTAELFGNAQDPKTRMAAVIRPLTYANLCPSALAALLSSPLDGCRDGRRRPSGRAFRRGPISHADGSGASAGGPSSANSVGEHPNVSRNSREK